jgi:hypothetical protein
VVELKEILELQLVHRALMAARFAENPSDSVLLGSPYLAIIHSSVVDEIIAAYRSEAKFGTAARWDEWREFSKDRLEWDVVRKRLSLPEMGWNTLPDNAAKRDVLMTCFEPFRVPPELIDELVQELDQVTKPV